MSRSRKRAPEIATSRVYDVVEAALLKHESHCLDDNHERDEVAAAIVAALLARPEAVAIRAAFANAPTQVTKLVVMREIGGDAEGELLAAAARLAGAL